MVLPFCFQHENSRDIVTEYVISDKGGTKACPKSFELFPFL